jgi:hypothetical protein
MSTISNLSILASAGTGKTFRLSDRIIQLLAQEGVEHQNIAALTFTRAAAAEFIVKLVQKLQEAATDEKKRVELCDRIEIDAAVHDQKWFQDTLRTTLLESNRMTICGRRVLYFQTAFSHPLKTSLFVADAKECQGCLNFNLLCRCRRQTSFFLPMFAVAIGTKSLDPRGSGGSWHAPG